MSVKAFFVFVFWWVCRGQKLHPHGCNFLQWLDQGPCSLLKALPSCSCEQACVLRRVMSIRNNGSIFARCASKRCAFRVWLGPYQIPPRENNHPSEELDELEIPMDGNQTEVEMPHVGRWRRSMQPNMATDAIRNHKTEVFGSKGISRKRSKKVIMPPQIGALQVFAGDSDDPLTSGDDEDEPEETLDPRQLFQLLSLEESQKRLQAAQPPPAPAAYQKRWGRVQTKGTRLPPQVGELLVPSLHDFRATPGFLG